MCFVKEVIGMINLNVYILTCACFLVVIFDMNKKLSRSKKEANNLYNDWRKSEEIRKKFPEVDLYADFDETK